MLIVICKLRNVSFVRGEHDYCLCIYKIKPENLLIIKLYSHQSLFCFDCYYIINTD